MPVAALSAYFMRLELAKNYSMLWLFVQVLDTADVPQSCLHVYLARGVEHDTLSLAMRICFWQSAPCTRGPLSLARPAHSAINES